MNGDKGPEAIDFPFGFYPVYIQFTGHQEEEYHPQAGDDRSPPYQNTRGLRYKISQNRRAGKEHNCNMQIDVGTF